MARLNGLATTWEDNLRITGRVWRRDKVRIGCVAPANILYVNFEDERLAGFRSDDCERLMEAYYELNAPQGKTWLFLDEIQNVPAWEKWLNRLYEFEEVKIFVRGLLLEIAQRGGG